MRPDGAPDDYNAPPEVREALKDPDVVRELLDDHDPTGYYERKMKRVEEVLPYLAWIFAALLVMVSIAMFFSTRSEAQGLPVPLEEPCPTADCTVYNQAFLFAFTGDERTLKWKLDQGDVDNMDLIVELTVFEFPEGGSAIPVMKAELVEADREFGWTPNRAGTYFVKARACRTDGDLTTEPDAESHPDHGLILCSILATSIDPAHTDPGVYPRGFIMLIKLAPATGGTIE